MLRKNGLLQYEDSVSTIGTVTSFDEIVWYRSLTMTSTHTVLAVIARSYSVREMTRLRILLSLDHSMSLFIVSYNSMMAPKKELRSSGKLPNSSESPSQSNALISLIVKRFPVKL